MKSTSFMALAFLLLGIAFSARYAYFATNSAAQNSSCQGPARIMARLDMLFGRSRPTGEPVTDEEWAQFLDTEVTRRFPDGLTVLQGLGQWRGKDGHLTRERSTILVIWHEPTQRTGTDIEAIRSAYKQRFDQESVMRVDSASCVSF